MLTKLIEQICELPSHEDFLIGLDEVCKMSGYWSESKTNIRMTCQQFVILHAFEGEKNIIRIFKQALTMYEGKLPKNMRTKKYKYNWRRYNLWPDFTDLVSIRTIVPIDHPDPEEIYMCDR